MIFQRAKAPTRLLVASTEKIMANGTDSAELQVCYSANAPDTLIGRQCLVENETEAANRWRKRNLDVINLHRRRETRMVMKLFR